MADWQEKIGNSIRGIGARQEAARAKVREGVALSADSYEQLAGFQLGAATAMADSAVDQLRLLSNATNPLNYAGQQLAMTADGIKGLRTRGGELAGIVKDNATRVAAFTIPTFGKGEKAA